MCTIYVVVVVLAALANSVAAALNFVGAASVKATADRLRVSRTWMIPFGMLLAAGAVGLVSGFAVPVLGEAAAIGLVLYFVCALAAHARAHDRNIGGAVTFLVLAVAALIAEVGRHHHGC
jgi:hypothetical protein